MRVLYRRIRRGKMEIRPLRVREEGEATPHTPTLQQADQVMDWLGFSRSQQLTLNFPKGEKND